MAQLNTGEILEGRELVTIHGDPVHIPDPGRVVHLQFRRFASCPVCNVHLRSVTRRYDEITAAGIREVVVFHSRVEAMLPHQGELPFATIADPDQRLYGEFGVRFSARSVLDPRAWGTPLKPYAWSVAMRERRARRDERLSTRGESMLGLPAEFLVATDGRLLATKYGRHANDQWSVDELLALPRTPEPHAQ